MHECWFENTLARLSALRIKKNLTEIQVLWWKYFCKMIALFNLNVSLCKFYLQAEDSGVGDE